MTHAEPQRHAQPTGRPGAGAVLAEQMEEAGGKRAKSRNIRPLGRLLPFLGRHRMDAGISAIWLIGSTVASLALTATARGAIDQGFESGGAHIDKWFLILGLNAVIDRKSTRLNSSHVKSSYAVFCSKKKTTSGTTKDA